MTDTPEDMAEVESLLAERDSVHGWLTKLDSGSSASPEAVRNRVRGDYQSRLDAITDRLAAHADIIGQKLNDDRDEHQALAAQMEESREALAEVELRHTVGEYTAERFENERSRHAADLEAYELSINAVADRISRLEDVEALVSSPAAVGTEVDEPAPVESPEEPTENDLTEDEPVPIADLEVVEEAALDAESLLSVFGESVTIEPEDLPPEEDVDPSASPLVLEAIPDSVEQIPDSTDPQVADFGPLSFTPSGEFPATPARSVAPPPIGMPEPDQKPRFVRPGGGRGSELSEVGRGKVPDEPVQQEPDNPEALDENGATPRTLRCGECGAMNRPLEWYCEKCGAELTAV